MKRARRPRRAGTVVSAPKIEFSTVFARSKNPNYTVTVRYKDNVVQEVSMWDQFKAFASLNLNNN
jgi:hypothetical protein